MIRTDTSIRSLYTARAVLDDLRDVIVEIADRVPADQLAKSDAVVNTFTGLVESAGRRQVLQRRARNQALFSRRFKQVQGNAVIVQLVTNCQAMMERQRDLNPNS